MDPAPILYTLLMIIIVLVILRVRAVLIRKDPIEPEEEPRPRTGEELVRMALDLEADYLDRLGEHEEASRVRARVPKPDPTPIDPEAVREPFDDGWIDPPGHPDDWSDADWEAYLKHKQAEEEWEAGA